MRFGRGLGLSVTARRSCRAMSAGTSMADRDSAGCLKLAVTIRQMRVGYPIDGRLGVAMNHPLGMRMSHGNHPRKDLSGSDRNSHTGHHGNPVCSYSPYASLIHHSIAARALVWQMEDETCGQ